MCYDSQARPPMPPGGGGHAQGRDVTLTADDGNSFAAYLATPDNPTGPRVLIMPDVRGLHEFYKDLARRFAEQGIAALTMDYFGRTAGLTPRDDDFEWMPHVMQIQFDTLQADVAAALVRLRTMDGDENAPFTLGFCMGGTFSLLTGTQDRQLSGVIGFYPALSRGFGGAGTILERAMAIKRPVLALFGGDDPGIPANEVATFEHELRSAGIDHTVVSYAGAPHSFFDRRATDFATESSDAWAKVLDFIASHSTAAANH